MYNGILPLLIRIKAHQTGIIVLILVLICFSCVSVVLFNLQADVQVTFGISDFQKAQVLDPSWTDPQILCRKKGASVEGGLGPFGLLVLASKGLQEYTAVFFRIFKAHNHKYNNKYLVLMCSDQSRSLSFSLSPSYRSIYQYI